MTFDEMMEAIEARHSVRAYKDIPIEQGIRNQLNAFVDECNKESGLNITIQYDDPEGFDSRMAHYGSFRNVSNYIVLKGKKIEDFEFVCGYYGETQGHPHRGKSLYDVIDVKGGMPEWFVVGVDAALLAPTAVNQQKFVFTLDGEEPAIRVKGFGSYTKVDLGIAAYHFDVATGKKVKH